MAVISVRDLRKTYRVHEKPTGLGASIKSLFRRRYKYVRAVDGISFDIEPGEMVGFLGPNGAGKTTTLKILSGLIYPTGGSASVLGFRPQDRHNAYRRQFALLMGQKNQLWWDLPAAESFRLHKEIYAIEEQRFREVQGELVELLGVGQLINQPVRELSLGERMKMELIAALLHSPRILFLDEPTIGLDVVAQASIRRCLRAYNRDNGVTVLLTSHYMQDVEALCDRVMVINHGRLIQDGPLTEITSRLAGYKTLTLRFDDGVIPDELDAFGTIVERNGPKVTMRLPSESATQRAAELLSRFPISDIRIEDPPIEDVISELFQTPRESSEEAEVLEETTRE